MSKERYQTPPGHVLFCIHGLPRSGTSWLGEIFNSHPRVCYKFQPLFSYALKECITNASPREEIEEFFRVLVNSRDKFLDQDEARAKGLLPTFSKEQPTHVGYKEVRYHQILPNLLRRHPEVHVFLIVRDPRATIHSWWKSPREFRPDLGWNLAEEWRYALRKNMNRPEEYNGFERWKEGARLFSHLASAYPRRVRLIRYTDLIAQPMNCAKKLFESIGLDFADQTKAFLEDSQTKPAAGEENRYSVFRPRQQDAEWLGSFPNDIARQIKQELANTELSRFLDE